MKITTWNVNSVKARLELILAWLKEYSPDVCALQEIKCLDEAFPYEDFESLGYNIVVHGQKSYNGVALLSKYPMMDIRKGLPGKDWPGSDQMNDDIADQARYIEAVIDGPCPVRVTSIYVPNGNPIGTDKYSYKLRWLKRLSEHAATLLSLEERTILSGDFNIIPQAIDCYNEAVWRDDALYMREVRDLLQSLCHQGFSDAFLALTPEDNRYTFWDYQAGAWQKNEGIRIDHHLLSPQAADILSDFTIHKDVRGISGESAKPSDHVPVSIELTTP